MALGKSSKQEVNKWQSHDDGVELNKETGKQEAHNMQKDILHQHVKVVDEETVQRCKEKTG